MDILNNFTIFVTETIELCKTPPVFLPFYPYFHVGCLLTGIGLCVVLQQTAAWTAYFGWRPLPQRQPYLRPQNLPFRHFAARAQSQKQQRGDCKSNRPRSAHPQPADRPFVLCSRTIGYYTRRSRQSGDNRNRPPARTNPSDTCSQSVYARVAAEIFKPGTAIAYQKYPIAGKIHEKTR